MEAPVLLGNAVVPEANAAQGDAPNRSPRGSLALAAGLCRGRYVIMLSLAMATPAIVELRLHTFWVKQLVS